MVLNNVPTINISKKILVPASVSLIVLTIVASIVFAYKSYYKERIYPGITIANYNLSNLTKNEAVSYLSNNIPKKNNLSLVDDENEFDLELANIGFEYDFEKSANAAYSLYRTPNSFSDLVNQLKSPITKTGISIAIKYDEAALEEYLAVVAGQLEIPPSFPSVKIVEQQVIVDKGKPGQEIDKNKLKFLIVENLKIPGVSNKISIPLNNIDPTISDTEALLLRERAQKLTDKSLELEVENNTYSIGGNELFSLLDSKNDYSKKAVSSLIKDLSAKIERPAQNSVFNYDGVEVIEFLPARDGIKIDKDTLSVKIVNSLKNLENGIETTAIQIPVSRSVPDVTTEEVNDLGIKELIGVGKSNFRGSIAPRIHNIGVAATKFNGVLIAPDKILSFNDVIGDISSYTGYKQAYIIKDGRTVLGDGGGVCQVSTTLFRAALNAGLPIVERRAHSYRVSYYEQGYEPGLDATVYSPLVDLKIKNDTPGYILIQTLFDPDDATLVFEIYGTSDGRVATVSTPVITSQSPPPVDLYIDDPTKPVGHIEQIDWAAWGAKTYFDYTVERDGEIIIDRTFYSNFRPWQAKYLRGTNTAI